MLSYVPGIGVNLFSIGKATDRGITAIFEKDSVRMYRGTNLELIGTRSEKDLYQLNLLAVSPESSATSSSSQTVPVYQTTQSILNRVKAVSLERVKDNRSQPVAVVVQPKLVKLCIQIFVAQ
ncbi:hypothetical protein DAPPUDRAFT_265043 [Daphnia pulex]|uniref:Uncharacterized protein n=1 Tax=Daphnia pulex TaxID=6669 RepID=E9HSS0_DAPPU|nr:hypothetical protein DAPPUDRAFT_265043 [Daphnia pulex]|eukprot:EFX65219.1 hypothetical protein DAPPUDRAFT_265043 [Daphnia pulex]